MITRQLFGIISYNSVDAIDSLKLSREKASYVDGARTFFTLKLSILCADPSTRPNDLGTRLLDLVKLTDPLLATRGHRARENLTNEKLKKEEPIDQR